MDDIKLRFLGAGDSESLRFYNTNLLITKDCKRMLIDCGWTAKQALADAHLSVTDIDAIFITHVHGDHVFGLERFGFESRYVHAGYRIRLFVPERVLPVLWDECLKGCMGYSSDGKNELNDFFDVQVVRDKFVWQNIEFLTFPTTHTKGKPSFGLRLPHRFTFTSDTNVISGLEQWVEDDLWIFHDAWVAGGDHPAHATIDEMKSAYSPRFLRRIWLMHYDDAIEQHVEALRVFAGWVKQGEVFSC